jgi:alkyl hydroperoxide reductase subunit AhpC
MIELGQLERRSEDFARRNTRVIVVSMEGLDDAKQTQERFPRLVVLADQGRGLSEAAKLIDEHNKAPKGGGDIDAPTTILVDRHGKVRAVKRPPSVIARLTTEEVLQAVDQHMSDN